MVYYFTAVYDQAARRLNRVPRGQQIPRRLPSQSPPAVACFSKELLSFVVPEHLEYPHQRTALPVLGRVDQVEILVVSRFRIMMSPIDFQKIAHLLCDSSLFFGESLQVWLVEVQTPIALHQ